MNCTNSQFCRDPHFGMLSSVPAKHKKKAPRLELWKRATRFRNYLSSAHMALKERGLFIYLILLLGSIFALLLITLSK